MGGLERWIGIATLRCLKIGSIPEELQYESLHRKQITLNLRSMFKKTIVLMLRILYRLRFLSEQATFDAATFSYAFPLLSHILVMGGVIGGEEGEPVEQEALTVEIFKFHSGECKNIDKYSLVILTISGFSCQPCISQTTNH